MSTKKDAIDMQLLMAVKASAILQGEINCNLNELVKKAKLLQKKEGEVANHLLEMIFDNLNELIELFKRSKNLENQIENLKRTQKNLLKE